MCIRDSVEAVEHELDLVGREGADTGEGGSLVNHLGGDGAEGAGRAVGSFLLTFGGEGKQDAGQESRSDAGAGAGSEEPAAIEGSFPEPIRGRGRDF